MKYTVASLVVSAALLFPGCGKYEAAVGTAELTDEVAARITAGAEKYRIAGWTNRSMVMTDQPIALTPDNMALVVSGQMKKDFDWYRHAGALEVQGELHVRETTAEPIKFGFTLNTNQIQTPRDGWTKTLHSPQLLDVETHPTIEFVSTHVGKGERLGKGRKTEETHRFEQHKVRYPVAGKLTFMGETRELTIPVDVELSDGRMAFATRCHVDLTEYLPEAKRALLHGPVVMQFVCPARAFIPEDEEIDSPAAPAQGSSGQTAGRGMDRSEIFKTLDLNGDGFIKDEEIPERMRPRVEAMDTDKDGGISLDEFLKAPRRPAQTAQS